MLSALALAAATASPAPQRFDVLISAGHEGRPASCAFFPKRRCNLGAAGERQWTPVVADEVARVLRRSGYSVARKPADFFGTYEVRVALFLHFDGTNPPCGSGASIGYHDQAFRSPANLWRTEYAKYFPFRFQPDNFTDNLKDYYGFRQVSAGKAALVLELGEITCPQQRAWLSPRLQWLGKLIAFFAARVAGGAAVPEPGAFQ